MTFRWIQHLLFYLHKLTNPSVRVNNDSIFISTLLPSEDRTQFHSYNLGKIYEIFKSVLLLVTNMYTLGLSSDKNCQLWINWNLPNEHLL